MEHKEFARACEALLLSPEFRELRDALEFREPNLWHILGISRKEIWISRFLAWLLDPQANHSWEDQLLKNLIVQALQTEIGRQSALTPVDVLVLDLSDVEVSTEYKLGRGKCDILAHFPSDTADERKGFLCIIENKIGAKEGPGQTDYYYQRSCVEFSSNKYPCRVYIYLSPDGDPPQNENFIPLSYQDVLQVVKELLAKQQVTQTERFLLQQFQENILRDIAMDPKTIDLARTIYDQNQDVFELVFDVVKKEQEGGPSPTEQNWDGKSRFFNIGDKPDSGYRWEDCRKYSFICAGGGSLYRNWMEQLKLGDIIYAYVSKRGYVGIATVTQKAVPFREARLDDGRLLSAMKLDGEYNASEDDDTCDWVAFVKWEYEVDKDQAVRQEPITRATTSRIYDHRKDAIEQVESELAKRSA
jgi:hypothetical protein